MVKTRVKQVLAMAIAVIMLFGACFTGAVSVAAASLTDGLTEVATVALDATEDKRKINVTRTDIQGGGVKVEYSSTNSINANYTYSHKKNAGSIFGNTFTLQFNDYKTTSTQTTGDGYKQFQVILGASTDDYHIRLTGGVAAIRFDTLNGNLLFVKGTNNGCGGGQIMSVIATDDALKYENISGKAFTLKVSAKANWTKIDVTVVIDGTTTVSGIISKTAWNTEPTITGDGSGGSLNKLPSTATYFSVGGTTSNAGSVQPFSIEYYGFKAEQNPGNEDGSFVDYTTGLTEVATTLLNACGDNRKHDATSVTDIQGGGIKLAYGAADQANAYYSYAHKKDAGSLFGNKFTLQFNDYKTTSTYPTMDGYKQFQVILGAMINDDYFFRLTGGVPAIRFDTANGKLLFVKGTSNGCGGGQVIQEIATNDALKYDNFTGKPFTLTVSAAAENWTQIDVSVVIDGTTTVTGAITKASWDTEANIVSGHNGSSGKLPTTSTYFAVSGTTANARSPQPFSIEYYGFKAESLSSGSGGSGSGGSSSNLTEGLTDIAAKAEDLETRTDLERTLVDLDGGGVSITWNKLSGYAPYRWNVNMGGFPGNGIKLQFANYKIKDTTASTLNGYGQIVIALSSTTVDNTSKIKKGVPFLQIDTVNGNLMLRYCKDDKFGTEDGFEDVQTLISNNNALKYENFKEKPFSITFKNAENGTDYVVELDINGTVLTSTINGDKFNVISFHPTITSTYMSIGGIDNSGANRNGWSIEYYGYKAYPQTASSLLNGLTEIATAAKNAETRTDLGKYVDITGGGVALDWQKISGYGPYRFTPNIGGFPGDGLMLQFSNYKINTVDETLNGYGQIVICFSTKESSKIKSNIPFLQIDTVNGKVDLRVCNDDSFGTKDGFTDLQNIIAANDTLKYANIKGKPFQVKFEMADNGVDYKLTVDVAGTAVTGTILKEKLDACTNRPTDAATYISIGGIDNSGTNLNKWSIEFYGTKNYSILMEDTIVKAENVAQVDADIAALPTSATLDDSAAILLAKAKYDALTDDEKATVTGAEKLTTLMGELNTLRQNNKYKPTSTYIAREPSHSLEFGNPGSRTVYSSVTEDGFKAEWRGATQTLATLRTQAISGSFKLDGLRVHIDNFTFDEAKASDFWVQFTSGDYTDLWDGTQDMADRMIAVRMGMKEDKLEINGAGMTASWFAGLTSWMQRDNFKDKSMVIEWFKQSSGDYVCTITLDTEVLAFTVSASKIAAMDNFDEDHVKVVIGTQSDKNVFSMDVNGVYAELDSAAKNVMSKIDALPDTITSAAQAATVDSVYNEYSALTTAQSEQVLNNEKLTAARAAVRTFEGVDDEGRDVDGYYIPDAEKDIFFDNATNSAYASVTDSAYGGWHVDFNNGGYGVKNCFAKDYVIDGLSLRFDNFNYGHGSSFFVGFESSTSDAQLFNFTARSTMDGIWLLIGQDSTIYSTYGGKDLTGVFPLFEANEKLSAANLLNKEFFISWEENDDGTLTMTFTVDNTDFVYHYDTAYMEACSYFKSEEIQIVFHNANGTRPPDTKGPVRSAVSFDVTGLKFNKFSGSQMKLIQEIIDAIDKLPETATYEIEETIQTIRKMYFSLDYTELRLGVTNYSKLVKLQDALFDMHVADGTLYAKAEELEDDEDDSYDDEYDGDFDGDYSDDGYEYDDTYVKEDEDTDTSDEQTEDNKNTTKKPTKVSKDDDNSAWWIIAVIAAVVILAVVATIIIILKRKVAKEEK